MVKRKLFVNGDFESFGLDGDITVIVNQIINLKYCTVHLIEVASNSMDCEEMIKTRNTRIPELD